MKSYVIHAGSKKSQDRGQRPSSAIKKIAESCLVQTPGTTTSVQALRGDWEGLTATISDIRCGWAFVNEV